MRVTVPGNQSSSEPYKASTLHPTGISVISDNGIRRGPDADDVDRKSVRTVVVN